MGSYRGHNTTERDVRKRESSSEATEQNWVGSNFFHCEAENDLAERLLLLGRKVFGLTTADVMRLAYQLAVRNGIHHHHHRVPEGLGVFPVP